MHCWSFSTVFLFALISATAVPAREIDVALLKIDKRQISIGVSLGTGVSSTTAVTTPSATTPSATTPSVIDTTSTIIQSPTVSPSTTVVSSTITRATTNSNGQSSSITSVASSTITSSIPISYSQIITSATSDVVQTYTEVQGGSTVIATRTTRSVVPVTTSTRVTPTALASDSGSGSGGLSGNSKKIIGGVVGGIGGALVVGALAYTAWRIWGKKKNLHDDDLYDPNANTEKVSSSTDQQPFRSTLDQYHNPGPVNTASNF